MLWCLVLDLPKTYHQHIQLTEFLVSRINQNLLCVQCEQNIVKNTRLCLKEIYVLVINRFLCLQREL